MKVKISLSLLAILAVLFTTACGSGTSAQSSGGTRGVVTSVGGTQIEIAVLGERTRENGEGDGRNEEPQGSRNAKRAPADSPPAGNGQPSATPDLSDAQRVKYAIDEKTKIVAMQRQGNADGREQGEQQSSAQEQAASLSDITAGMTVSVTPRAGDPGTADKIVLFSAGRAGNGTQQPDPSGT